MKEIIREVRYSIYLTIIISFIFFQWLVPFKYKCNIENITCFACGLRTAVDFLFQGNVLEAYNSNKLIVPLIVLFVIITIDVLLYLLRK